MIKTVQNGDKCFEDCRIETFEDDLEIAPLCVEANQPFEVLGWLIGIRW